MRGYWLGGGGFIKVIGGWYNLSANPPLQILFNILPGILAHILLSIYYTLRNFERGCLIVFNTSNPIFLERTTLINFQFAVNLNFKPSS